MKMRLIDDDDEEEGRMMIKTKTKMMMRREGGQSDLPLPLYFTVQPVGCSIQPFQFIIIF